MAFDFPRGRRGRSDSVDEELDQEHRDVPMNERTWSASSDQERDNITLAPLPGNPVVLSRDEHNISRKRIDPDALKILYRLQRNGHRAFLVGGSVRDLLLGKTPKDFDIGTDASPEQVRALFRNSRIIGRRFRINHVYFYGNKIMEVATFRAHGGNDAEEVSAPGSSDNTYGDPQTDAFRRDLTINGLFYDASNFSVIDYVGGIADLRACTIRVIGDSEVRFQEDPVRMIRAIRHAARTGFVIEPTTYAAIGDFKNQLHLCAKARVYEEFVRDLRGGHSLDAFRLFEATGLLAIPMPALATAIAEDTQAVWGRLEQILGEIDREIKSGSDVNTGVLFAAVMMGNFPRVLFGANADPEKLAEVRPYWELSPQTLPNDGRHSGRRSRGHPHVPEALSDAISEVFKPLGVSRKDREWMEQVLVCRLHLIESYVNGDCDVHLGTRDLIRGAIALLRITALDEVSQNALEFWDAELEHVRSQQSRTKRRGRRRRGRKPRPN